MDSQDGWRLRPEAQPVSYLDPRTGQWTSGSFDTAVKSEHPAVRSSGVQPQATAGQVPQLPSDCVGIMPKIRALAAAAGQPMSMGPQWPNPWAAPMQEAVQEEESASPPPGSLGGRRRAAKRSISCSPTSTAMSRRSSDARRAARRHSPCLPSTRHRRLRQVPLSLRQRSMGVHPRRPLTLGTACTVQAGGTCQRRQGMIRKNG